MASYKIPQDVEADDKLVGPFTFRQFIFLIIAAISAFLTFQFWRIAPPLVLIPLPVTIVFLFLGVYRRPDQPVEIYLLALLRFYFKPHRRVWDSEGVAELVQITAPKLMIVPGRRSLNPHEAKNQLKQLAQLMDTRGWSAKNAELQEGYGMQLEASDRLFIPQNLPQPVDVHQSDDMLDFNSNPVASNLSAMAQAATNQIREQALSQMQAAQQRLAGHGLGSSQTQNPSFNPYPTMHQRVVSPLADTGSSAAISHSKKHSKDKSVSDETTERPPDILKGLAQRNDLSVGTIEREAKKTFEAGEEISLH